MDNLTDSAGNPKFPDVSGNKLTGTCSGTQCPAVGQQGHSGRAAPFDGTSNSVRVPQVAGQGSTTDHYRSPHGSIRRESLLSWDVHVPV